MTWRNATIVLAVILAVSLGILGKLAFEQHTALGVADATAKLDQQHARGECHEKWWKGGLGAQKPWLALVDSQSRKFC